VLVWSATASSLTPSEPIELRERLSGMDMDRTKVICQMLIWTFFSGDDSR
jgi:hypothetical protein